MCQDVHWFISHYSICQQTKYETRKPVRILHPLPIASSPWEDLFLDFITDLPQSHGYTTILVVVARFSKGVHCGTLLSWHTTYTVALLFLDMLCKLHGFPYSLVSDRKPLFINNFWHELFQLSGMKLCMSTSYHPETSGQTDVLNRVLEQYLQAFVHDKPTQWFKFLTLAKWSYNTFVHTGTRLLPFKVTYGKPPPLIPFYLWGSSLVELVDSLLTTRATLHEQLQRWLAKTQAAMKHFANTHRR